MAKSMFRVGLMTAAAGLVLVQGRADAVLISGSVQWTDPAGGRHPARRISVLLVEENPWIPGPHVTLMTTDLTGAFSTDFIFRTGASGFALGPAAQNDAGFVSPDGTVENTWRGFYFSFGTTPPPRHIVTPLGTSLNGALSVADAMYTTRHWGAGVRLGEPAPAPVSATYPTPLATSLWNGTSLHILDDDTHDWDVISHEYSHYLDSLDVLSDSPGGAHTAGVSNIPGRGKHEGVRLAWGEGLANWAGVASHQYDAVGQNMPVGVPNVGDTAYTDTVDLAINIDYETFLGAPAASNARAGEGDENSVAGILWDIGDAANEPHDRVAVGHDALYSILRSIRVTEGGVERHVEHLDDVWDHFTGGDGGTVDYATIVNYGAIFQNHNVSPTPITGDLSLVSTDPEPTIEWLRGNDAENDDFHILFLDAALDTILMDIVVGDDTEYTLGPAQWAYFATAPGSYRYVITGADTSDGVGPHAATDVSGAFWSDAYEFNVVPGPGALALLGLGGVLVRRRRLAAVEP